MWSIRFKKFSIDLSSTAAFLILASVILFTRTLWAEDVSPLPNESIWQALVAFVGGLAGGQYVGFLAIAGGVVSLLVIVFRTTIGKDLAGIWTLAVLYGLSAVAILLQGLAAGTPISEILRNGALLGAVLNSINEIIKHAFAKPADEGLLPLKAVKK